MKDLMDQQRLNNYLDSKQHRISLIETAKENHLDPYRYLVYALKKAVHLDQKGDNWVEALLPESAPDECKSNAKLN